MSKIDLVGKTKQVKPKKEIVLTRIAELTDHVARLRKELLNSLDKNYPQAKHPVKNPFVFWYSPKTSDVSCHLLGNHISAPTIGLLLDLTESHICEIYNELHETNYTSIEQLSYDDEPEKWSQERLIKEYKKLQDNMARRKRNKSIKSRVKKNEAN